MKLREIVRFRLWLPTLAFVLLLSGCSDSTGPDELAPLVGTWRAQSLVLTNQAPPNTSVDLVEEGATFTISILGSGGYSASLTLLGAPNQETGTIQVSGNQITITPTSGAATTGTWSLTGGILYIDGETEFDFNLDGTREPADVSFELYQIDL